eukprot:1371564-Heterocapsa_arctica.AAC.1
MGRALRAEPEPAKRKPGRPLGSKKKKTKLVEVEEEDIYLDEQYGGASGSTAPREAKRPAGWEDDVKNKRRRSARLAEKRRRDAEHEREIEEE